MFLAVPTTPLLAPVFSLITGILLAYVQPLTLFSLCCMISLFALSIGLDLHRAQPFKKTFFLHSIFTVLGFFQTYYKLHPQQTPLTLDHYRYTVLAYEHSPESAWPAKITLTTCPKSWWETSQTILMYTKKIGRLKVGDTIKIAHLTIQRPHDRQFGLYLAKEGFDGTAFVPYIRSYLKERPEHSLTRWISAIKESCIKKARDCLSPAGSALFLSVFLGNKDEHKETLKSMRPLFQIWGLSHQLARSGLHLIFFIPLLSLFLSMLPLPYFLKKCIALLIVGTYALLSWSSISFLRACFCFFILHIGTLLLLFIPPIHILLLTTVIVLVHNPLQLFFLDFQLSFFLSFVLLWINHIHRARNTINRETLAWKK